MVRGEGAAPEGGPRSGIGLSPRKDVSAALAACRPAFLAIGVFSAVINVLALTGSIYMLQVYDRVITSRSVPTLIGLTILMVGLYFTNGVIELLRTRITPGSGCGSIASCGRRSTGP